MNFGGYENQYLLESNYTNLFDYLKFKKLFESTGLNLKIYLQLKNFYLKKKKNIFQTIT